MKKFIQILFLAFFGLLMITNPLFAEEQKVTSYPEDVNAEEIADDEYTEDIDIERVARQTVGFTGSDIATICNEAGIVAMMHEKKFVDAVVICGGDTWCC